MITRWVISVVVTSVPALFLAILTVHLLPAEGAGWGGPIGIAWGLAALLVAVVIWEKWERAQ